MRKLIILLLFIPLGLGAQNIKNITRSGVNNRRDASRINNTIDTTNALKSIYKTDATLEGVRYIDYDLEDGWTMQEGRAGWNDDDKTLEVGLDRGSVLQMGQELHVRATNQTGSAINDGQVVYVSGASGNRPTITLANNENAATAFTTIGIATQDISNNQTGYVTLFGLTRDIKTDDWPAGSILWLDSIDGAKTDVRPAPPNIAVVVGVVLRSHATEGIIGVRIIPVFRLAWLSDVKAQGEQTNNDILQWNTDSLFWESRDSIAIGAMYYTDTYWDDMRVPLTNTKLNPLQSEPEFEDTGDGIFGFAFDTGNDSVESLHFIAQIPHSYKEGTDIEAHIHWSPSTTNTDDVVWKLFYKVADIDDAFPAVGSFRVIDAADGTALQHQITELGEIDGTGLSISAVIIGNVTRLGDAPEDDFTGVAYGWEIDFHFQIDQPGSSNEDTK